MGGGFGKHMSVTDRLALLSLAIGPKTLADAQRLARALDQLTAEDPTFSSKTDQQTGEVVIAGMGELHLEIIVDRLKREFHVEASVGRPRVTCKETLTRTAEGEMKYALQVGGRSHYGHVRLRLHPAEPGTGCIFENGITGGAIPRQFIKPVEEGVKETLARGVVAGYPIDDVRVELYDGSYHDVDSTTAAFRIAGSLAAWIAVRKAGPVVLEPVMRVEVSVPTEHAADVMKNISARRGRIQSWQEHGLTTILLASVPLAGLFGYATDLRSRTRGRGTYATQFERYHPFRTDDTGDDERDSLVGAPLRPVPTLRASGIALPEPDEDPAEN
jgi:elongation factor G